MSSPKRFKFAGMTSTKASATSSKEPAIVRFYDPETQDKDAFGRTQEDILTWSPRQLESSHNYIQILFPLPEGSPFNFEAPIINREIMDTFRSRQDLQDRLRLSFEKMLDFYGFEVAKQEKEVEKKEEGAKIDSSSKEVTEETTGESTPAETTAATTTESEDVEKNNTIDEGASNFTPSSNTSSSQPGYNIIRAPHWRTAFRNWVVRFDHNHLRITRILRCLRILGLQIECDAFFKALKDVFDDQAFNISERTMMYWTRAVTRRLYMAPDDERIEWLKMWEKEQEQQEGGEAGKDEL